MGARSSSRASPRAHVFAFGMSVCAKLSYSRKCTSAAHRERCGHCCHCIANNGTSVGHCVCRRILSTLRLTCAPFFPCLSSVSLYLRVPGRRCRAWQCVARASACMHCVLVRPIRSIEGLLKTIL